MKSGRGAREFCARFMDWAAGPAVAFDPASGRLAYANRDFCELIGVSPAEELDESLYAVLGEESERRIREEIGPLLSGGAQRVQVRLTLEIPFQPSKDLDAVFSLARSGAAGPIVCASLRDDTPQQEKLRETLARCEERERTFLKTPQALLLTDAKGLILEANPSAHRLFGFAEGEMTGGLHLQSLFEGDADREILAPLLSGFPGGVGALERLDLIGITRQRQRVPIRLASHVFADARSNPRLAHFLSGIRDVIEMERKLEEVQLQLIHADKMASLGKLAAGVAHEMNNPLGGIMLFGSVLLEDLEPDDPRRENVTRIMQEARRCSEIVSALLDFAHQRKRHRETVDLGAALKQCLTLMGGKALFSNIEVVTEFPGEPLYANGNPSQLKQVFTNILSNAVDAMQGEGRLTIGLAARPETGEVLVTFRDTGPGIPPSSLPRIFDPFFTTKEPGKGTGLGLSLSYNIVKMHHGDIHAANVPGGGAEFVVTLPVQGEGEK